MPARPTERKKEIAAFFQMGGYAAFVWPSLGLTLVIMLGLLVSTLRQLRARQRRLAVLEAEGATRRPRGGSLAAAAPGEAPTVKRSRENERSEEAAP